MAGCLEKPSGARPARIRRLRRMFLHNECENIIIHTYKYVSCQKNNLLQRGRVTHERHLSSGWLHLIDPAAEMCCSSFVHRWSRFLASQQENCD
jgi:hypothetical protein